MCGRNSNNLTYDQIYALYRLLLPLRKDPPQKELDLKPRYNVAPPRMMPVLRLGADGTPELALLKWGLIPSWAKDAKIGYKTINARAETVATAPAFRAALKRRRCLIPSTGY